jgi:hypothetical protein
LGRQDHDNFDFEKIKSIKPELSFLSSPIFNTSKKFNDIPMDDIISVMKDYLKWDVKDAEELICLGLYMKHDGMPSIDELIQYDLSYKGTDGMTSPPILGRMHEQGKVNTYFISYFISLKEKRDLDAFKIN